MVTATLAHDPSGHVAAHMHALFPGEGYWPSMNIIQLTLLPEISLYNFYYTYPNYNSI